MAPIVVQTGEHHREQTPGGGVVNRARAQRNGSNGCSGQFLKMDNAREHWERGDAHRCAEEKHSCWKRSALGKQVRVVKEKPGQPCPERERRQNSGKRDRDRALQLAPHDVGVEIHSNHEHVKS